MRCRHGYGNSPAASADPSTQPQQPPIPPAAAPHQTPPQHQTQRPQHHTQHQVTDQGPNPYTPQLSHTADPKRTTPPGTPPHKRTPAYAGPRGHTPPWATPRPPHSEEQARQTLADRFARGDITVEEFMERASALNWTPGQDEGPRRSRGR